MSLFNRLSPSWSVHPSISIPGHLLEWLTQEPLSHCHESGQESSGTSDCWRFLERRSEFLPVLGYIPPDSVWFLLICFSLRNIRHVLNDSKHSLWFLVMPGRVQYVECSWNIPQSLQWRHNERDGVSNHQPHWLLKRLFRRRSKKTSKAPRHWPLWGEFTGDRWIPRTKGQ